jgi:hypothetical protein
VRAYPTLNGRSTAGRPSKRSKQLLADLLEAIEAGAPFNLACQSCGIHVDSFQRWRRDDPAFAAQVDQAAAKGTIERLKEIGKQGKEGAWPALAWLVERRNPAEFGKPEVQLNVGVGVRTNLALGANGQDTNGQSIFESVVVADLEYLGLRRSGRYEHQGPRSGLVHDIEAETVVPEELSGSLRHPLHPGCDVISESQARALETQAEEVHTLVREKFAKYRPQVSEVEKQSGSDSPSGTPITMPAEGGEPERAWWDQLVRSGDEQAIEQRTAIAVCRLVLASTIGKERAARVPLDFEGEGEVTVGDLFAALEELSGGAAGWRTLLQFAGYAQAQD